MEITKRERYLMQAAIDAAEHMDSLDGWLGELVSDGGHTVEQLLSHEAMDHVFSTFNAKD